MLIFLRIELRKKFILLVYHTAKKKRFSEGATCNDPILSKLVNYHFNGWPKNGNEVDDNVKFYFKLQNEIHIDDDLVFGIIN